MLTHHEVCEVELSYVFTKSFPYLLNRVGVLIGELFSRELTQYGITLPMYRVLAAIEQEGPQRLGDLANLTSIEISTLSRLVSTMKKAGHLSRQRPEEDGRTVEIDLTELGHALVKELMPLAAHYENVGISSFTAEEAEWLKQSLVRVYGSLQQLSDLDGKRTE